MAMEIYDSRLQRRRKRIHDKYMGAGTGGAGWANAHPGKKSRWAWSTLKILAVV